MIDALYTYSQLCLIVATLSFGACLIFIGRPRKAMTIGILRAKWALVFVYLFVGFCTAIQYHYRLSVTNPNLNLAINLTSLCIISFMMCLAVMPFVSRNDTWRNLLFSAIGVVVLIVCLWLGIMNDNPLFDIFLYLACALYVLELIKMVGKFIDGITMDDILSKVKGPYKCWIFKAVIAMVVIGVLYAVFMFLPSKYMGILNFCSVLMWAYVFISFVNLMLHSETYQLAPLPANDKDEMPSWQQVVPTHPELQTRLDAWVGKHAYRARGVTMVQLARQFDTNRSYLSAYINSRYGCNFNTWLTRLRLDEAKKLMLSQPDMSVDEVARSVGFSSKSHFTSSFKLHEHVTPGQWRKSHLPPASK